MGLNGAIARGLAVLMAAWAGHHPGFAYGLSAPVQKEGAVASYAGVAAWWERRPDGRTRLMVWRRGRVPEALDILLRGHRRTVDVGPGPDGAPWLVYPVCDDRACDLWAYDLRTRAVHDLRRAAVAGAIWGGTLLTASAPPARLAVSTVGAPAGDVRTLRQPRIDGARVGAVTGLDLRGDRYAYTAWESGNDVRTSVLREGRIGGGTPKTLAEGGSGEECSQTLSSPSLGATSVTWLYAVTATYNSCGHHARLLRRRDEATGAIAHAQVHVVSPKAAAAVGAAIVALSPEPHDDGPDDRDGCVMRATCQVRLTLGPRWVAGAGR